MPSITGSWPVLSQADFEEVHPNGGYFHFRENTPAHQAVRESIAALGLTFGWPLRGIWISGTGLAELDRYLILACMSRSFLHRQVPSHSGPKRCNSTLTPCCRISTRT
jgi:hypothetical protein